MHDRGACVNIANLSGRCVTPLAPSPRGASGCRPGASICFGNEGCLCAFLSQLEWAMKESVKREQVRKEHLRRKCDNDRVKES